MLALYQKIMIKLKKKNKDHKKIFFIKCIYFLDKIPKKSLKNICLIMRNAYHVY